MKKILLFILLALILSLSVVPVTAVYAGTNNMVVQFSTVGPDTYADGETVLDGESYALVWTPTNETFSGINSDGSAIGNSKIVAMLPFAKNGCCPNIQFQVSEEYATENYPNGTWGVYLLDTRKYAMEKVTIPQPNGESVEQERILVDSNRKKIVTGVGGAVNGCVMVISGVKPSLSPAGVKDGIVQNIPAGIQPPKINDFMVINDMAYIFLEGRASTVSSGVAAGQSPGSLAPSQQQSVLDENSETIIVTPAKGASGFFSPVVQTTFSTGNIWIVITIATTFIASVVILALVKKKKGLNKNS